MLNLQLYFAKMFLFNLNQIINKKLTFTLRNPQVNTFLNLNRGQSSLYSLAPILTLLLFIYILPNVFVHNPCLYGRIFKYIQYIPIEEDKTEFHKHFHCQMMSERASNIWVIVAPPHLTSMQFENAGPDRVSQCKGVLFSQLV